MKNYYGKYFSYFKGERLCYVRFKFFNKELTFYKKVDGTDVYVSFADSFDCNKVCYIRRLCIKKNNKLSFKYAKWRDDGNRCSC